MSGSTDSPYQGLEEHLKSDGFDPQDLVHLLELNVDLVEAWDALETPVRAQIRKTAPSLASTLDALSMENSAHRDAP